MGIGKLHKGLIGKLKLKIAEESDIGYKPDREWNPKFNKMLASFLEGISRPHSLSREELVKKLVDERLADNSEDASNYIIGIIEDSPFALFTKSRDGLPMVYNYSLERITNAQGDERFRSVYFSRNIGP